jgi:hypothetical protein
MTAPPPHAAPALDRFRAAVLADAQIQQRLAEQQDAAAFTRIATEWASGRGIAITAHDLRARPNPLGVLGSGRPPHTGTDWPPAQWLPVRVAHDDPGVDWCHFAGERLAAPFYANTVRRMPDGFVFHMSRCGSTLVAQMLAVVPDHVVASEAELVDYGELPGAVLERILGHFGAEPDGGERALMQAAGRRNAKAPATTFDGYGRQKRRDADDATRAAAERHLADVYARLTALRTCA